MCGPVDSPYPCIGRFVRPNTNLDMTDMHGFTTEGYTPLRSVSEYGVGKPTEMVKGYAGDGSYNEYGAGNTFDFRFGYRLTPADDGPPGSYGSLYDRLQLVHHSGKELPIRLEESDDGL
jgi:hypothetical protein